VADSPNIVWSIEAAFDSFPNLKEPLKAANVSSRVDGNVKLVAIKNALDAQPLALTCKFFSITYAFLGSVRQFLIFRNFFNYTFTLGGSNLCYFFKVLSVILTYSIILFQMRVPK